MLATFAPRIHAHMSSRIRQLLARHSSLRLNFSNSAYPAASFNFGPETVCYMHTDAANDPCNWCQITALGTFNPKTSGQIVLSTIKTVVEFPSGSTILIPSAVFKHGNVPIQPGESRQSFTQYCAGGLLRWVECGFRTLLDFGRRDPAGRKAFDASLKGRVDQCVQRFSTMQELVSNAAGAQDRAEGSVVGHTDGTVGVKVPGESDVRPPGCPTQFPHRTRLGGSLRFEQSSLWGVGSRGRAGGWGICAVCWEMRTWIARVDYLFIISWRSSNVERHGRNSVYCSLSHPPPYRLPSQDI